MPMSFAEAIPVDLFRDGPYRWRLLVRALADPAWLQIDDQLEIYRAEKAALLASRFDDCFVAMPGSESAAMEILRLVRADLVNRGLPDQVDESLHPLDAAGRLIQEDLVLMERQEHEWVMTAGSLCFPTRWDPVSKIGRGMDEIHAPVPQYESMVGSLVNRFFDRMQPGSLVWRPNGSLVDEPTLRLDVVHREMTVDRPTDIGTGLWLRTERQTLRRLEQHPDAICFTIRVHRWSLAELADELAGSAFARELASMPVDIADYKNIENVRGALGEWLETLPTG